MILRGHTGKLNVKLWRTSLCGSSVCSITGGGSITVAHMRTSTGHGRGGCVRGKEKRETELSEGPWSVSMNGLSREKLSLIVKLFGRSFFYTLMLNSSTFLCNLLFSFVPQNVSRSRFLAKLFPDEASIATADVWRAKRSNGFHDD